MFAELTQGVWRGVEYTVCATSVSFAITLRQRHLRHIWRRHSHKAPWSEARVTMWPKPVQLHSSPTLTLPILIPSCMEQGKTQSNSGTQRAPPLYTRLPSLLGSWRQRQGADKWQSEPQAKKPRAVDPNLSLYQKSGKLPDHTSLPPPHKSNFSQLQLKKSDAIILSFRIPTEKKSDWKQK